MNQAVRSEAGFTLIETLVALFVVAMLATTGGALLVSSLEASRTTKGEAERVRQLEIAHALLRDDLAAALARASSAPGRIGGPAGFTGRDGSRAGEILSFVRGGRTRLSPESEMRSDLMRIDYSFDTGQLHRKAWLRPDPTRDTPAVERVLLDGVARLQVRYRAGGAWSSQWRAPDDPAAPLPDLVELTATLETGETLALSLLVGSGG